MEPNFKCKYCSGSVSANDFFCPSCGKQIKTKPLDTGIVKQLGIYLFSVLLPPLGLFPAIKYLKQPDANSKRIGIAAIVLTIIATVVTFWLLFGVMDEINKQLNTQFNSIGY